MSTVSAPTHAYLASVYGARTAAILKLIEDDPALGTPLCAHHHGVAAEVVHAVREEWARTIGDVLLRRVMLGITACQGLDRVDAVAARIASLLGWDDARTREEVARYRAEIEPMRRFSST